MKELDEILIEVSQNCNLNCIMCGFGYLNNRKDKFMSFETFKSIFEQLKAKRIRLNGRGESTIHPDFVKILDYSADKASLNLFSNGNYINDEINERFIRYKVQLFYSIDAPTKVTLEKIRKGVKYERVIHNLLMQKNNSVRPFICFTLQEENFDLIEDIAKFAIKYNCNLIYNVVRRDVGYELFLDLVSKSIEYLQDSLSKVKVLFSDNDLIVNIPDQIAGYKIFDTSTTCGSKAECPAIDKEIFIAYNGDVGPCNMFNPYVYGNLNDESIDEIWNGEKRKKFILNQHSYYYCKNCACLKGE